MPANHHSQTLPHEIKEAMESVAAEQETQEVTADEGLIPDQPPATNQGELENPTEREPSPEADGVDLNKAIDPNANGSAPAEKDWDKLILADKAKRKAVERARQAEKQASETAAKLQELMQQIDSDPVGFLKSRHGDRPFVEWANQTTGREKTDAEKLAELEQRYEKDREEQRKKEHEQQQAHARAQIQHYQGGLTQSIKRVLDSDVGKADERDLPIYFSPSSATDAWNAALQAAQNNGTWPEHGEVLDTLRDAMHNYYTQPKVLDAMQAWIEKHRVGHSGTRQHPPKPRTLTNQMATPVTEKEVELGDDYDGLRREDQIKRLLAVHGKLRAGG